MALYSNTLAVIRQYLSSAVGDLILSTAAAPLSTQHYTDSMLTKADNYYNDHHYRAYCYEGTNLIGQEREVYDWVYANRNLLFIPAFSSTVVAGYKFELHRFFTEDEYRKAINLSIEALAGKYLVDIKDESTITLAANTYEYALPTSMLYLYRVITEKAATGGIFDASDEIDPRDWSIIKSYPPKLKLHEDTYAITAGKDLRLEGQGTQPIVDDDTDVIYIPPDWLVQKAITFLPQEKIQSRKLDNTYRQALVLSAREPRVFPNPFSRHVVE